MLIEPTETESVETLDAFADALIAIAAETEATPELVTGRPAQRPRPPPGRGVGGPPAEPALARDARRRDALPRLIRAHSGAVRTIVRLQVDSPTDAVDSTGSAPTRTTQPPLLARWLVSSGRLVSGPRDRHGDIKLCGRAAVAGNIGYVTRSEENHAQTTSWHLCHRRDHRGGVRRCHHLVGAPGRVDGARRFDRARRVRVRGGEHGRRRTCRRSDPAHLQRRDRPSVAEPPGGVRRRRDRGPGRHEPWPALPRQGPQGRSRDGHGHARGHRQRRDVHLQAEGRPQVQQRRPDRRGRLRPQHPPPGGSAQRVRLRLRDVLHRRRQERPRRGLRVRRRADALQGRRRRARSTTPRSTACSTSSAPRRRIRRRSSSSSTRRSTSSRTSWPCG